MTSGATCVIMQPTYVPWAGYFNLIAQADVFVLLDDVQFEKQSWQNRNRVLVNGAAHWLTVPCRRESLGQKILDVEIDDSRNWRIKQYRLLEQTYARHPYVAHMLSIARHILDLSCSRLSDLNIRIIRDVSARLGLPARVERASELDIAGQRTARLVAISRHFDCGTYLSPVGSAEYLQRDGDFEGSGISLRFQAYSPQPYPQHGHTGFANHLSVLDVVANLGWEATRQYVATGSASI